MNKKDPSLLYNNSRFFIKLDIKSLTIIWYQIKLHKNISIIMSILFIFLIYLDLFFNKLYCGIILNRVIFDYFIIFYARI